MSDPNIPKGSVHIDIDTECAAFTNKLNNAAAEAKIPLVIIIGLLDIFKADVILTLQNVSIQVQQDKSHGGH